MNNMTTECKTTITDKPAIAVEHMLATVLRPQMADEALELIENLPPRYLPSYACAV